GVWCYAVLCPGVVSLDLGLCFFFQAEDGIRDWSVTGVQTCALPIFDLQALFRCCVDVEIDIALRIDDGGDISGTDKVRGVREARSEERRVGKEGRYRGWRSH